MLAVVLVLGGGLPPLAFAAIALGASAALIAAVTALRLVQVEQR